MSDPFPYDPRPSRPSWFTRPGWLGFPNWFWVVVGIVLLFGVGAILGCRPGGERPPGGDTVTVDSAAPEPDAAAATDSTADYGEDVPEPTAEDTLVGLDTPPRRGAPVNAGLPVGPTGYESSRWCSGFIGATVMSGHPDFAGGLLRAAHRCGMRLTLTFPRAFMTTNGESKGPFSPTRARALVDRLARALPPDTLRKYQGTLLYFSTLDDMGCTHCWGGRKIPNSETLALVKYAQQKLGTAPIGVRVDAPYLVGTSGWAGNLDLVVAQWHTKKGGQLDWYRKNAAAMTQLGIKRAIYAVNVADCLGVGTRSCTPDELRRYGATAITFDPGRNCGNLSWKFEPDLFRRTDYQAAWKALVDLGRSKPRVACAA